MRATQGLCVAVVGFMIASCDSSSTTIDDLVIRNETSQPVHKVEIRVPETHAIVGCGMILAGSECSMGFPAREYKKRRALLSWQQEGHSFQREIGELSANSHREGARRVLLSILPGGKLESQLD